MFETLKTNLTRLGYTVSQFATAEAAAQYLNEQIDHTTVGFGGSVTLAELGLYPMLAEHNEVFWHQGVADPAESQTLRLQANAANIYLSSVNGIAETGEIVNIDGNCNRVAAIFYGHEKVYLIVGKNKVAPDYDAALYRTRNVAAPRNAQRLGRQTPCVVDGVCHDCHSPQRICRGLSVLWTKPGGCDYEIVLVEQDLGY